LGKDSSVDGIGLKLGEKKRTGHGKRLGSEKTGGEGPPPAREARGGELEGEVVQKQGAPGRD